MKKTAYTILTAALLATTASIPVSANESGSHVITPQISTESSISLEPGNISDGVTVSEVKTFDEIVKEISDDMDISMNEAITLLKESSGNSSKSDAQLAATTYRTFSKYLDVSSYYKPQLKFYCQTTEGGGSFRGIVQILTYQLLREHNGTTKQFSGTLYTNLEHANKIHWIVNGDFFNYGTTTVSGGGAVGLKGFGEMNFTITNEANHFRYHYEEGDFLY
ncbi:hypothetical protein [Paenibacillus massiliensis]|uniref:hypothetical protein n=1 Tax=Paenibacillus massiliensis TaxID=225917 RepID=UPI000684DF54|nr:hypothetical protein [Paenibacillus massiliensis]